MSIKIQRVFARASQWTFQIPPIKKLVEGYVGDGIGWADPFAGSSKLAEFRNDHNPERRQPNCLEAEEFGRQLKTRLIGVLFDPPFSYRQVSEHYKLLGKKATAKDTSYNFYHRSMLPLIPKIMTGGHVISFGWSTNGFPKQMGFEILEILICAHGMHHNDTLVTVQRRVKS